VFQDAAGDETFVPIPEDDRQIDPAKPLLLDAPTMAWASVRLVTSSGVLTRPVRRR
jgi:N-glycosylase/DNA lyase